MKKLLCALLTLVTALSCLAGVSVSAEEKTPLTVESYEIISGDKSAVSDVLNGNLTDGQIGSGATADLESGLWYCFETGKNMDVEGDSQYATIILDLGGNYLIDSIRANHLGTHPAGIQTPWGLFAEFSHDGTTWTGSPKYANTDDNGHGVWGSSETAWWTEIVYDAPVSARYVKFKLAALANASKIYLSELEVYGTENTSVGEGPDVDPESPLYQKMALFVGDSICEAYCEWNTPDYGHRFGWGGRILYDNDMRGVNLGKSGASISDCRGANTVLAQLEAQSTNGEKYDYVIVHGGANDAWDSCAVGTITEGFEGPFDMATFGGGLETTFKYLKETYPNAYYGFIINFQLPSATHGRLSDMSEYFTLAKEICDKWEIPYLDLYFDEDFNKNQMQSHLNVNLPDYIHPNTAGYNIITPVVEAWMETLHIEDEPVVEESSEAVSAEESAEVSAPVESSAPAEDEGGIPVYVYIIIVVVVVAVAAVILLLIRKKK